MKVKKIAIALLVAATVMIFFTGCRQEDASSDGVTKLTYWKSLNANTASVVSNLGETEFAREWQTLGKVEVEFLHPPTGQANEKFSVLTASNNMPDIIEYTWVTDYLGGPSRAINDGVIIDLGKYKEYSPHFFNYLSQPDNKNNDRLVKTDLGEYFGYPSMVTDSRLTVSTGLTIRYDWLRDLGLEIPETIDEWTKTLTAFRDQKGAVMPYLQVVDWYPFVYAYNIEPNFYVDGATIKYGRAEDAFRDYLTLMNMWYNEGLIGKNFVSDDTKTRDYHMLNDLAGAAYTNMGGGIGRYMAAATNPDFELGGAPFPVLNKGDYPEYGERQIGVSGSFAAITTSCEGIEAAMRFLDMAYEPDSEAYNLYNFGVKGKSYNIVDGYPKYTDEILKNPDGKSVPEAMSMFLGAFTAGPYLQDFRYFEQYAQLPVQRDAIEIWAKTNEQAHKLPHLYVKQDELNEYARLSNDVETYANEMILKFIMGVEHISSFESYIATLKVRGLDRLLEIKQGALDRYNAR